jgi:DNA polymerase iota
MNIFISFYFKFLIHGCARAKSISKVFLDVTDLVDYNFRLLTRDLSNSFFCLSQNDPTVGFAFDASKPAGHVYDEYYGSYDVAQDELRQRLILGSHLARHMRLQLEEQRGYTSTVGISTSKLLSKLVGNVNKPNDQTTLLPPYDSCDNEPGNVCSFIDSHDIGKIPNIGFKMADKLRKYALQHLADRPLLGEAAEETRITVHDIRTLPNMSVRLLDKILSGPGMPHGIASKAWDLLNGVDESEVSQARELPRQISIEDSYGRLDTLIEVHKQLVILATSLIKRMRIDLTEDEIDEREPTVLGDEGHTTPTVNVRWLAHPKTLRLSTRPRLLRDIHGNLARTFNRVSRSTAVPTFLYDLSESVELLAEKLVIEYLLPLFRRLHPEKTGWDLSLLNVAITNLVETAGNGKNSTGRDIGKMFRNQEDHLRAWKVEDRDVSPSEFSTGKGSDDAIMSNNDALDTGKKGSGSEDMIPLSQASQLSHIQNGWDEDEDEDIDQSLSSQCPFCASVMPYFAMPAHLRFHEAED